MKKIFILRSDNYETLERESLELAELQSIVGGYIEPVSTPMLQNAVLVVDEEGKLKRYKENLAASVIFANPRDIIVGNAILVKVENFDMVPFDEEESKEIEGILKNIYSSVNNAKLF